MHWESAICQIHICQLNSKGNTGSQTCISGVIPIFIAGMFGFQRNSTTMKLAPLGDCINKNEDPCPLQKNTHIDTHTETPKELVNLLLIKNRKFPSYTYRISLHNCAQMCFQSFKGCIYNVDGITASGVHQYWGHTTDLQRNIVIHSSPMCWYYLQWKKYII